MKCNCAGTAPGYPQHEAYCGQEPDEDRPLAYWDTIDDQLDAMCADAYRRYVGWTVDEG